MYIATKVAEMLIVHMTAGILGGAPALCLVACAH
jgi:hypothetical protein